MATSTIDTMFEDSEFDQSLHSDVAVFDGDTEYKIPIGLARIFTQHWNGRMYKKRRKYKKTEVISFEKVYGKELD